MLQAHQSRRIIAMDLDGTLFNSESEISDRTLAALANIKSAGHETVAVTGRSWRTAYERLKPAIGIDHIVCSNGAYLYRQSMGEVIWHNLISPQDLLVLVSMIQATLPTACFGWESESGLFFEPEFRAIATNPDSLERGGNAGELGTSAVYKFFVRTPDHHHTELLKILLSILGDRAELTSSGAPFVEVTAAGTHKASGLARVAVDLGVSAADTIAFGDNLNDIPMLKWAGISVAMGNALPEVKAIATNLTESNLEDGVALFLEQLCTN